MQLTRGLYHFTGQHQHGKHRTKARDCIKQTGITRPNINRQNRHIQPLCKAEKA